MYIYLAVGIGGVIGALLRYFILIWFINLGYSYPAGTLCVNLIGCFILGYLQGIAKVYELPGWLVTGVGTGIIGAFTTFSTFSIDVIQFIKEGFLIPACTYILASSIGGYYLAYTGFSLSTNKRRGV
ncbi:fluoride efflux transporter CrcB [Schinkia azotoformans]|uniref:Fluoride-specific ion channel FluC n=1 Tax=Schinkia azotoformans LMG 9581 TaxID=1131731 RepID=K6DF03_SCHAZ|nr:fluoride efflux transporter CrcB [Schinkia azotoformans]EKN71112.1 crcB protein [Schinkia azotoformans LMG 9581]MEC1640358.1 fluoride efflux transporter CrcB [Schinkia azotoformans]MEC1722050.1 fluoride efflux transporter CrcB [Schinkia azotoformans]MEC1947420.1 fluoride efflux transporter CrcB [Schinkia azotoformans]MED4354189.1 fluoride efflux transporter CrcB [Schinkia azotoformans]